MPSERPGSSLNLEAMGIQTPHDMVAEQAVLGAALLNSECIPDLVEFLRDEMFYSRQHGEIYSEIVRLFSSGQAVDHITITDLVVADGIFESREAAIVYLTGLIKTVPSISRVMDYARIVEKKYIARQLQVIASGILEQSVEEPDAKLLLESAEQKLYELRSGRDSSALTKLSRVIVETITNLQRISGPDKDKYRGIPTGFTYLDSVLTGGLGRSDLIILAARPGMGKTSFALNIAANVAKRQQVPVAIFSLEMTKDQLAGRILSSEAGIESQTFRTGALSKGDWDDLAHATDLLYNTPLYMDDTSGITIPEIRAKLRKINQDPRHPDIGLVIIDYLQLMTSGRRTENRVQEISEITRSLKIMAKDMNIPVIALSQLNRAAEKNRTDHRPQLSDLRDSGSIEQDADIVLFLYREGYYNSISGGEEQADSSTAECIVAKNRHGETGKVDLGWDGAHTRFMNIDYSRGGI